VVRKTSGALTFTPVIGSVTIGGCVSHPGLAALISSMETVDCIEEKPPATRVSRKVRAEGWGGCSVMSMSPVFDLKVLRSRESVSSAVGGGSRVGGHQRRR